MNTMIDHAVLDEQTFGEKDLRNEVLNMFLQQAPMLLNAIHAGQGVARSDAAHRLKGSCLAIGALALAGEVSAVEENPASEDAVIRAQKTIEATLQEIRKLLQS